MKLRKLGLAASAVAVVTLVAAAGLHNARAQGFDDEGGRDRAWATKGQPADAQGANAASPTATPGTTTDSKTRSWKQSADPMYDRRSHSLTRATAGTGVKTPPWAAPSDTKAAANNEGTVVKMDSGWARQGTWKGPSGDAPAPAADIKMDSGNGAMNTAPAMAPDNQAGGATAATGGPAPSMATPSE